MRRLFLSHSSKDAALTTAVSQQLRTPAAGTAFEPIIDYEKIPNYDVLVDQERLARGRYWPTQLHEWLARCHAGVVLLTEDAVKSAWVLKETSIMEWRLDRDPTFRLFIARFPQVSDALLNENKFNALDLSRIHQIKLPDPGGDTPDQYRERAAPLIAETLRTELGNVVPQKTWFDEMVGTLGDLLEDLKTDTLQAVAERVHAEPPAWSATEDARRQYIEEIARKMLSGQLGGFGGVHDLIGVLAKTMDPVPARKFLNRIAPYWVDAMAATQLRRLSRCPEPRPAGINGAFVSDYTGEMYVRRAHFMAVDFILPEVGGGDSGTGPDHIEQQICQWFRDRKLARGSNAAIRAKLENPESPVYVVLPDRLDNLAMKELRRRFKRVTFIMPVGEKLIPDDALEDFEWIEPECDVALEQKHEGEFFTARAFLENG
jgi:hypothetical protein